MTWLRGGTDTIDAIFAQARQQGKPVLLFWNARWCYECQDMRANVLSRRDVVQRLKSYILVDLDWDAQGAQKLSIDMHLGQSPHAMVILDSGGSEVMRIPTRLDLGRYAELLDPKMMSARPAKVLLDLLEKSEFPLNERECRRLAYGNWLYQAEIMAEAPVLHGFARAMSAAARQCPSEMKVEKARLIIQGAVAEAEAESRDKMRPAGGGPLVAGLITEMSSILSDTPLAVSVADCLFSVTPHTLRAADENGSIDAKEFRQNLSGDFERAAADPRFSDGTHVAFLSQGLYLAKVDRGKNVDFAALLARAEARMREILSQKHDPGTRASVISESVGLYQTLDQPQKAYSLAESELENVATPYFNMQLLAGLDDRAGRAEAALGWMKRAYEESSGPITRFRWGVYYLRGLLRLRPSDVSTIRELTSSLLGDLGGPYVLEGDPALRLKMLDTNFRRWNVREDHADVLRVARLKVDSLCATSQGHEKEEGPCRRFLSDFRQ